LLAEVLDSRCGFTPFFHIARVRGLSYHAILLHKYGWDDPITVSPALVSRVTLAMLGLAKAAAPDDAQRSSRADESTAADHSPDRRSGAEQAALVCDSAADASAADCPSTATSAGQSTPRRRLVQPVTTRTLAIDANTTVVLPSGVHALAEGRVTYEPPVNATASFAVLPALVSAHEVASILSLAKAGGVDADPDTVDAMPTFEMHVFSSRDEPDARRKAHAHTRAALRKHMDPIVAERITPFVRQRYPQACGRVAEAADRDGIGVVAGTSDASSRECTPCYSLVKRYRPGACMACLHLRRTERPPTRWLAVRLETSNLWLSVRPVR
jgi:hypothetical protein